MSLHIHLDPVLPRLLQCLTVEPDMMRGDLFEPRNATPGQQAWPADPFAGGNTDLVRPSAPVTLPAAALGLAGGTTYGWIGSWRLRWSALVQRGDWSEHGIWIVPVARQDCRLLAPFNATVDSMAGRWSRPELLARRGWQSLLTLFVPHRAALPADCVIAVNAHPDHPPRITALVAMTAQFGGVAEAAAGTLPQIVLLPPPSVAAGTSVDIPLQVRSGGQPLVAPCDLYLEASAGYLPRRRQVVNGGVGLLRFSALGLDAGDSVHLKAGWKFWPGAAEADIAIV